MKELLEYLGRSLVDDPESVRVEAVEGDNTLILQLHVANDDIGKVIGRQGRIAKAIRNLVKASAIKENKKVTVEIID